MAYDDVRFSSLSQDVVSFLKRGKKHFPEKESYYLLLAFVARGMKHRARGPTQHYYCVLIVKGR